MRALAFMTLFLTLGAHAGLPERLESVSCKKQIEATLKKHQSKEKWVRTVDPQANVFAFRTPTNDVGQWLEVHSFEDPFVFYHDSERTHVYQWKGKDCSVLVSSDYPAFDFVSKRGAGFSDADLKKVMKSGNPTMIYIWSPSMVYSMMEYKTFENTAKEQGLEFIALVDFHQKMDDAKKAISHYHPEAKFQAFKSLDLYMREGTVHFPSSYIVANQRISKRIFGVLPVNELVEKIKDELAELQRTDK